MHTKSYKSVVLKKNQRQIFVIIPDGVSLRNFAYSSFYKQAKERGLHVVLWHHTPFDLDVLQLNNIVLEDPKSHQLTTILKNVRKRIEIAQFAKRDNDAIYKSYLFSLNYKGIKNTLRSILSKLLVFCFNSEKGLVFIKNAINHLEQKTTYFKKCLEVLGTEKPDFVFCTSQRSVLAIAPLLAAQQLEIPTMSFVFSWDNLPKATLDVTADYYAVWSAFMKEELLTYYPSITSNQVEITGTPQFETHYNPNHSVSKKDFFSLYNLDMEISYVCYSGDDYTTSPKDPLYLRDVAIAIRKLNAEGERLGLIFRRCPVDFSNRYDVILEAYKDVIVPIEPLWDKIGGAWDSILPQPEDMGLLRSIAAHTLAVINLGSSMVFDFAIHQKPCLYMNYNYLNPQNNVDAGVYVYDYVHFRSKPNTDVVVWLNHPDDIAKAIQDIIVDSEVVVAHANQWYHKINKQPADMASSRILESIDRILKTYAN